MKLLSALILLLAFATPAVASLEDDDTGGDGGYYQVANDVGAVQTDAQIAAHGLSIPHWKWIWSHPQDKYVKKALTATPWPMRACTSANEGEVIDLYDEHYKLFVTYRCTCYPSGVCKWERIDRYSSAGWWAPNAMWSSSWPYVNARLVRDTHRLCPQLVCAAVVWDNHFYRGRVG